MTNVAWGWVAFISLIVAVGHWKWQERRWANVYDSSGSMLGIVVMVLALIFWGGFALGRWSM